MLRREYSGEERRAIREMKRAIWTQKGAGREYQSMAYQKDPFIQAGNLTEIGFVNRHVVGGRILDAGAGTGRFTIPLLEAGLEVVSLDISLEMLEEGRRAGEKRGKELRLTAGDLERLPFPDESFDSVVSIIVLRHFPNWRELLAECVRVLRPGGRLIFDMASGEHQAYLAAHGAARESLFDPKEYAASMTVKELTRLAGELDMAVVTATPYDFFQGNVLLERVLGDEAVSVLEGARRLLEADGAIAFHEWVTRFIFPCLSPALTASWLIALAKGVGNASPYRPAYRLAEDGGAMGDSVARLFDILAQCLGDVCEPLMAEGARMMNLPEARELAFLIKDKVLSCFPLEVLLWEADGTPGGRIAEGHVAGSQSENGD